MNTYSLDPSLWREYAEQIYRLTPGRPCLSWHNGLVKSHFVPGDNKVPWRARARANTKDPPGKSSGDIPLFRALWLLDGRSGQSLSTVHPEIPFPEHPRAVSSDPSIPSRLPVIPLYEITLLDLSWNKQAFPTPTRFTPCNSRLNRDCRDPRDSAL